MNRPRKKQIPFDKLVCGGNDFIITDLRSELGLDNLAGFTRSICHRNTGVGADGAIFLDNAEDHPFHMLLYNADGGRAEVSYNGSRCLGRYAVEHGLAEDAFSFASDAGAIHVRVEGSEVSLEVPSPSILHETLELSSPWGEVRAFAANAGVPYMVVPLADIRQAGIREWADSLKIHPEFPAGTNVAVIQTTAGDEIAARFFERGVEEETMSSGTGIVAVCYFASLFKGFESSVTIQCAGGAFPVSYSGKGREISDVRTAGTVQHICSGTYFAAD